MQSSKAIKLQTSALAAESVRKSVRKTVLTLQMEKLLSISKIVCTAVLALKSVLREQSTGYKG